MKKKLSLILCLVFTVLTMAACGTDQKSADYFGMTYEELQGNMEQEVAALVALNDENRTYIQSYGTETAIKLLETWDASVEELGAYQGLGEFNVSKSQNTMTLDQIVEYQERKVMVSYVYTYNYETKAPELTDASADKVYTLGEKMSKAGMNTLLGMGTVFTVLILISLIIYCFKLIPYFTERKSKRKTEGDAAVGNTVLTQIEQREEQQLTDDLELVAVISAAIAAGTGTSADAFVVRSIRRR